LDIPYSIHSKHSIKFPIPNFYNFHHSSSIIIIHSSTTSSKCESLTLIWFAFIFIL
jgi:hypothetical protein